MKIIEVCEKSVDLIQTLLKVWEKSVRATHLFLSEGEIVSIKEYVPQAISNIENLVIAEDENNNLVAFMGIENESLEMLFITPEERGKGLGKQLVHLAVNRYQVAYVDVNEQNPHAAGFYRHLGFETFRRDETDDQGNPFPILRMKLSNPDSDGKE